MISIHFVHSIIVKNHCQHERNEIEKVGNAASRTALPVTMAFTISFFGFPFHLIEHIFDKYPIPPGRVIHQHMGKAMMPTLDEFFYSVQTTCLLPRLM